MNSHDSINSYSLFSTKDDEALIKNLYILQSAIDNIIPRACRTSESFNNKAKADIRYIEHNGHDFQSENFIDECRDIMGL